MIIYVDNQSETVSRGEVKDAIDVLNVQIQRDFTPIWGLSAKVKLRRKGERLQVPPDGRIAHIHLTDHGQAGFHIEEQSGIAAGHVLADLPAVTKLPDQWLTWTVAFSHEVLELIADPFLDLLVKGPHPTVNREVFYYREICDPVQSKTYDLHGMTVSNFVLPHYYNAVGQKGLKNDFLDSHLKAFRWIDQGYVGFWDPKARTTGKYIVYPKYDPKTAAHRLLKAKGKDARLRRYSKPHLNDRRR